MIDFFFHMIECEITLGTCFGPIFISYSLSQSEEGSGVTEGG